MASGDRSGLWTFIDARNVRFARGVLRSALLQAQSFIVHCIKRIAAPNVCAALGISACADFHQHHASLSIAAREDLTR